MQQIKGADLGELNVTYVQLSYIQKMIDKGGEEMKYEENIYGRKKTRKFNLIAFLMSIILVVCIPFIFDMKTITSGVEYRGFPVDWLALYPNNGFSFKGLGFLVNVIVFYWLIKLLMSKLKKKREIS